MRLKFYFGAFACLALASCSQDEVLMDSSPSESAIGFASHVDNSSRTLTDAAKSNITLFKVWAAKTRNAGTSTTAFPIMEGQEVEKQGDGSWTYSPQRYWIKNNAYFFNAFACYPATGASYYEYTLPTTLTTPGDFSKYYQGSLTYNNDCAKGANGDVDLVWANKQVLTITDQNPAPNVVNFTFGHLLCKVNMKFINEFTTGDEKIAVYDASIENAGSGTLNLNTVSTSTPIPNLIWNTKGASETSIAYRFGNNAYKEILSGDYSATEYKTLIPNQDKITVSFKVKTPLMWNDDQGDCIEIHTQISPSQLVGNQIGFQCGYTYTLVAHLNQKTLGDLEPIKFSLEKVEDFVTFQNPGTGDYMVDLTPTETTVKDDPQTIEVHVNSIKAKDLVFLGDFVPSDYSYEWTITGPDGAKSTATFLDNSQIKTIAKGGYAQIAAMSIKIKVTPNTEQSDDEIYTVKFQIKDGDTVVGEDTMTITAAITKSSTGGSQDGDDNDG